MRLRPLGSTGLQVSEIALGTVELGMDYGFRGSEGHWRRPDEGESARLLRRAIELGINLFDTARAYGEAEEVIGRALAELPARPIIASKVQVRPDSPEASFWESLDASLRALRVEAIDILQIHYAPLDLLARDEIFEWFEQARRRGKVRFGGASFYEEPAAFAALRREELAVLQIPYNLLDQKMAARVLPGACGAGRGVLVRSAFLRGVLTPQVHSLDPRLAPLRDAALAAAAAAGEEPGRLAELALRFCVATPGVASVILGMRSVAEVEANAAALERAPLPADKLERLHACSLGDHRLLNPSNWEGLI
jgi:1-deoxyxylulose-5-phosphate synthase